MKYYVSNIIGDANEIIEYLKNFENECNYNRNGTLEVKESMSPEKQIFFRDALFEKGIKIYEQKNERLVNDIKISIQKIISSDNVSHFNISFYLSKELGYTYTYLTNVFSASSGMTIKSYIIASKIELIKNMLLNKNMSLKEIACYLKYRSASHLSNQFKKITGTTPTAFRKQMIAK